jgi:hypothetical protein
MHQKTSKNTELTMNMSHLSMKDPNMIGSTMMGCQMLQKEKSL